MYTKIGASVEVSWENRLYKGRYILPRPMQQGRFPTCVFFSFTKGGQLVIHRSFADKYQNPKIQCDILLDPESVAREFVVMNGGQRWDWNFLRKDKDRLDRPAAAAYLMTEVGADGESSRWEGKRKVAVDKCTYLGHKPSFDEVKCLLDTGKAVMAGMICGPDFDGLGPDEIYSCSPQYVWRNGKRRLAEGFEKHMILLIGHAKHDESGSIYTPFLNSHGCSFGGGGIGRVFFDDLRCFYVMDTKYPPKIIDKESSPSKLRLGHDEQKRDAGLAKTEDGKGSGKYVVPARRQ
ncbi:hypothetical protein CFC21_087849 [Triticum aestivum]|uniref:DUF295 domain-containing protein n=2 Tax=Triticum aestivum TaxID=4565 RepID=A0A9R1LB17_WHEAT|nr:uncharacterized protein LOC123134021 [Triticum aestivum]KAF7084170.1 hypothetical protein CFC21_087849 [Triticum aestivum]